MKNYFFKILGLIVALVLLLFSCIYLVFTHDSDYTDEAVYKIVLYLSERGISVDESLIDITPMYVIDMDLESITIDKTAMSKSILGAEPSILADTYTSETGTVAFKGNDFSFKSADKTDLSITDKTSLFDVGKKTQKMLESLGFNLDESNISVLDTSNGFRADVTKTVDGMRIFNNCISVEIIDGKFNQLWGRCYYPKSKTRDKREAKSIIDALILMSHDNINDKKIQIESIELGYVLTDTSVKTTTLRPVWRIQTDVDGDVYIEA